MLTHKVCFACFTDNSSNDDYSTNENQNDGSSTTMDIEDVSDNSTDSSNTQSEEVSLISKSNFNTFILSLDYLKKIIINK